MEKKYTRKCPSCSETVFHSSVASRSHCRNSKCRKCSDKNKERANFGKENGKWGGFENITLSYFNGVKCNAKKRNLIFNITIQDMWQQFVKQEKKCIYTGLELQLQTRTRSKYFGNAFIDRIDSSKGYTIDNIQWVHKDINWMKQDFDGAYFEKMCQLVSQKNVNEKEQLKKSFMELDSPIDSAERAAIRKLNELDMMTSPFDNFELEYHYDPKPFETFLVKGK